MILRPEIVKCCAELGGQGQKEPRPEGEPA
jgi:hypothetical protein